MRKITLSIIAMLASAWTLDASAQLADGFYHIKNVTTGRCISINDTNPSNYKVSSGDVNMAGIRTYLDYDTVAVSPSCVIFIKRLANGQYDLCGQGSSLYEMSSKRLGVDLSLQNDGSFRITGTADGITKTLSDGSPSEDDSWLMNRLNTTELWQAKAINTSNEFIGIRPEVRTADGSYYGTMYAGYNFRLVSPGMAAFYVSNAGGSGFTMNEIEGDIIPSGTPVIIRCNSADPEDNKIEPVIGGYTFDQPNWLGGVFCSLYVSRHHNTTLFDRITMRVLGLSEDGQLAFISNPAPERLYKDQFLMANKAYLKVNPNDADVMTLGGYTAINDAKTSVKSSDDTNSGIYTLAGVRLPEGATLRPGIYIQNGKKRIVR